MKSQVKSIFINPGKKGAMVQIALLEILYIEAKDHLINIHLQNEIISSNIVLKEILDALSNENFIRIHRSYIVNIDFIKSIENNKIHLKSNHTIPLSLNYREDLFQRIKDKTIKD
ncbi:LytTR family DNA-binding domain-containing protein [Pedobacter frigiditerrae]|uniref:LytR/AlgR family response regulator transcription factor n=1 Tax=Pedobacter frigiditerrae TaxID=2530452 RepID=UPI00292F8B5C|nr:LytTR family DNA-binding domain-containing protein [Pedobacter frigiditerrae]